MAMECQSCGRTMKHAEDHADSDLQNEFCSYCMVRGEWAIETRDEMKDKLVRDYKEQYDMVDEEAEEKVEELMSRLKRWM